MRLIIAILILIGIVWTWGMYVGLSKRDVPEYVHDPNLIAEVPVQKNGEWELIPPRSSELQGKRSAPGRLSPEMERRQAIHEIFENGRDPFDH